MDGPTPIHEWETIVDLLGYIFLYCDYLTQHDYELDICKLCSILYHMNLLNRYVYHVFSVIVLYICVSIYICINFSMQIK